MRLTVSAVLAGALAVRTGQALADDAPVRSYLDETTAATITLAVDTFVFARERTDLAVNARDYVSLVPIEVNRAGDRTYYWSAYVWSTIDRREGDPIVTQSDEFVLMADGRPIRLQRDTRLPRQLGIAALPTPFPVRAAVAVLFPTDPEILSYVGAATDLRMQRIRNGQDEEFSLWRDARQALRSFVGALGLDGQ